jgi:hypothetical protein
VPSLCAAVPAEEAGSSVTRGRGPRSQERFRLLGYSLLIVVAALTTWVAIARPHIGLMWIVLAIVLITIAGVMIWRSLPPEERG